MIHKWKTSLNINIVYIKLKGGKNHNKWCKIKRYSKHIHHLYQKGKKMQIKPKKQKQIPKAKQPNLNRRDGLQLLQLNLQLPDLLLILAQLLRLLPSQIEQIHLLVPLHAIERLLVFSLESHHHLLEFWKGIKTRSNIM